MTSGVTLAGIFFASYTIAASGPPTLWHGDSRNALLAPEDLQDCIDQHLLNMPDNQRSILLLRDMQQMKFEEICNELNLTASNVRVLNAMEMVNQFEETGSC